MPQISTPHTITQLAFPHITSPSLSLFALFVILSVWPSVTLAEVRVVTAQGEHRMGDRDTKEDAIRLATEAAKRNALEQVATYLESITIVDGLDVTKDEIRTYTAGLVLVLEQDTNTTLDGDTIVVRTDLVAQVDTEEVGNAIAALRENEDARHQLVALQQENAQLQQDLEAANQALVNASTAEQTQQATQQRQDILNRVQSNAMVSQAWTDWVLVSPAVYPYPWVGLAQTQALLNVAHGLYPASPYVQVAQQVITTRQPPAPPQPPVPPASGTAQPTMPSHQIVPQQPRSRPAPLTLNEISHSTPTTPPQIGNQPQLGQPTPDGLTDLDGHPPVKSIPAAIQRCTAGFQIGTRAPTIYAAPVTNRTASDNQSASSDYQPDPSADPEPGPTGPLSDCAAHAGRWRVQRWRPRGRGGHGGGRGKGR
jgi:hypothetical protein